MGDANNTILVVFDLILPAIISVIFLIFIGFRFTKLRGVGFRNAQKLNLSLLFRIVLLTLVLICDTISIFLAGFVHNYFQYHSYISLYPIIEIFTIILQIVLMVFFILYFKYSQLKKVYEFNKHVPLYFMHKIYWISLLLILITGLVTLIFIHPESKYLDYTLFAFRLTILTILNTYSLYIRKQDIYDFEDQPFFSTSLPEISDASLVDTFRQKSITRVSISESGIKSFMKIQINKGWSLIQDQGEVKVEIKMDMQQNFNQKYLNSTLPHSNSIYKVKKTIDEFEDLWVEFQKENKEYFDQNPVEYNEFQSIINQIHESTVKIIDCQILFRIYNSQFNYLLDSCRKYQPESNQPPLISWIFLKYLRMNNRTSKIAENGNRVSIKVLCLHKQLIRGQINLVQNNFAFQLLKNSKQNLNSVVNGHRGSKFNIEIPIRTQSVLDDQIKSRSNTLFQSKKSVAVRNQVAIEEEKDHQGNTKQDFFKAKVILFHVSVILVQILGQSTQGKAGSTHTVYEIEMILNLPTYQQTTTWMISKRYTDFYELDQTLKIFLGVKYLPPLPGKKINLDEKSLADRKSGLEYYLRALLEDKVYHHYALYKFIEIKKDLEEEFKSVMLNLIDSESFDGFSVISKGHELVVDENNKLKAYVRYNFKVLRKNGDQVSTFQKRFSQFAKLHIQLKNMTVKPSNQQPELPAKFTSFGQKTSQNLRERQLAAYLNQIFQIPNICEYIPFRHFINYNSKYSDKMINSTQLQQQNENKSQIIVRIQQETPIEDLNSIFRSLDRINEKDEIKLDELKVSKRINQ